MKYTFILILALFSFCVLAQEIQELNPRLGKLIDLSPEGEIEYEKTKKLVKLIDSLRKETVNRDSLYYYDSLYAALYDEKMHFGLDYWSGGIDCVCFKYIDSISASSYLKPFKEIDYKPENIIDNSYKTTWIEGVSGSGIGEYIVFHLGVNYLPIDRVSVVNGYFKSEQIWKDNSRVKKLKMYVNDKPFAILNLADSRQKQFFTFSSFLKSPDRDEFEKLRKSYKEEGEWTERMQAIKRWTIKFEILEVYEGDKYDNTAITDMGFFNSEH